MVTKEQVLTAVCDVMGVSEVDIVGPARARRLVRARHMAMFLVCDLCGMSTVFAALFFKRDHSCISQGRMKAEHLLETDDGFRESHRRILDRLADMNKRRAAA